MLKEAIFLIVMFVTVIALAYILTKKLASIGSLRMKGKNMKVLETLQLGMNQYLCLIKIADKTLIIGVSKDTIRYIGEVDEKSIDYSIYDAGSNTPLFEDYLKKIKDKINK